MNMKARDLVFAIALASLAAAASSEEAADIVRRMDASMAFDECEMRVLLEDVKASGARRELGAEVWYAKSVGTMIAFVSPPREKGKKVLMIGDSMWMAAPGLSKPVRLSGKDSFMGTSFTNDDVMNLDKDDDYGSAVIESGASGWRIELVARRRSLPYQRVIVDVGRDYLPTRQEMYLLSGELSKIIEFTEPRSYGSRRRPSVMKVLDATAKGASTTVRFERMAEKPVDRSRLSPATFMK